MAFAIAASTQLAACAEKLRFGWYGKYLECEQEAVVVLLNEALKSTVRWRITLRDSNDHGKIDQGPARGFRLFVVGKHASGELDFSSVVNGRTVATMP